MTHDFQNKVALVTGAGVGIGFAICQALAEAGAWVALNDLDGSLAEQAAQQINETVGHQRVFACPADVADTTAVAHIITHFASQHGRFDITIANAGITNYGPFLDYSPAAFDRVMAVNLRGSYFTAQTAAQQMIELGTADGRILLMSSVTGSMAYPNLSAYGISKAGIQHMAKVLAIELGPYGITVNALCPGAITTERTLKDDPQHEKNWRAVTPNGRVGQTADIAIAALFLASPAARHITGQTLTIDGGWTHQSPIPAAAPDLPEESSKLR
jgi:NAD(P)-dependent dehydrogenase (short-subunit alcohol dehydrogenase family)